MTRKHSLTRKKSLHRMLMIRIALVTIIVSAIVSAIRIEADEIAEALFKRLSERNG